MKIGIMSAMNEEIHSLIEAIESPKFSTIGKREYCSGKLWGHETVLVFSRWGKVASASTAVTLILNFDVDIIIFTGVAGAIDKSLNIGDIVIGEKFFQHDMDARPFFKQFEIPLVGSSFFKSNQEINRILNRAAINFIDSNRINQNVKNEFNLSSSKVISGDIASGDKFISSKEELKNIKTLLPNILCVEMEGAAVAQVCEEYSIPFGIIRTISDAADDTADVDFAKFTREVANKYSVGIIEDFLNQLFTSNASCPTPSSLLEYLRKT